MGDRRWINELAAELALLAGVLTMFDADVPMVARGVGAAVGITSLRRIIRQEIRNG